MEELRVEANVDKLPQLLAFIDEQLEMAECPVKAKIQIDIAVEEIFVNIAHYAYASGTGEALIRVEIIEEPAAVQIGFEDSGMPYNSLARKDPDVTLGVQDREIGGLGIFMVKKIMVDVEYEYKDGKNLLTLTESMGPTRKKIMVAPRGH